jgi:hypothetical protein
VPFMFSPCQPCCKTCKLVITVAGCIKGLKGAVVTLTQSSNVVFQDTTPLGGVFNLTNIPEGTYGITVSKARFNTFSGTIVFKCPANGDFFYIVPMTPSSGYVCCHFINDPLPTTLYITDTLGKRELIYGNYGSIPPFSSVGVTFGWRNLITIPLNGYTVQPDNITVTFGSINTINNWYVACGGGPLPPVSGSLQMYQQMRAGTFGGLIGDPCPNAGYYANKLSGPTFGYVTTIDPDNSVPLDITRTIFDPITICPSPHLFQVSNLSGSSARISES